MKGIVSAGDVFSEYLKALRRTPVSDKTEHTDRPAMQALLDAFAAHAGRDIAVQHEPKRVAEKGAPDFKVSKTGTILGYVETKAVGENLAKVFKSDQLRRYRELSSNIVLTDYLEWIWIRNGQIQQTETLCHETDLENRKFRLREDRIAAVAALLEGFFSTAPAGIGGAQQLALALAARSKLLRDYLTEELIHQEIEHQEGRLYGLFKIFRDQVFHELTLREFADAFAQMLVYGLFLARLNAKPNEEITLRNARDHVPGSFRLIRELVDFLADLERDEYREVRWVVEEVLSIVNSLDLASIHEDLSFRQRKAISRRIRAADEGEHRLFERDPFIYFYEDYLKAYDPAMRKGRGVYYTPPPIVNFIIRAVNGILKDSFGIEDGLADHERVTVLDFACGTGTFLLEVFQKIFENIGGERSARADLIVREHILKNLYGFEYLIAPYTIAHLKLSQYLHDKGHPLKGNERLLVYLTNTLEPMHPEPNFLLPAITEETRAAQEVKEKPILVIIGNPPYSGHSKNKGEWISAAVDGYKFTMEADSSGREIEKPLGEKNAKWLNDDYVKFIRFAQLKMDTVEEGVVGVITNHSWLENPTFRGMRNSLMRSFEQIYIVDLHGNAKKKEKAPDGSKDENVFDIEQGVAISIFVRRAGLERGVWRGDLWGKRLSKYETLAQASLKSVAWQPLSPNPSFYLFGKQDAILNRIYDSYVRLNEVYPTNVLGFQTHRDAFAISFSESEMKRKLRDLADSALPDDELTRQYGLKSNRDWSLSRTRELARDGKGTKPQLVGYRPFDDRWSEFSELTIDYPRRELLDNVAGRDNLCLLVPRQIGTAKWRHAFVTDLPAESCLVSSDTKSQNYVFPIRTYRNEAEGVENLSPNFRAFIDGYYKQHYDPEEVMGYIYAVLCAPTYRSHYAEFLRIDFPRIPFSENRTDFEALSGLGWELIEVHLLRKSADLKLATYHGEGDHEVGAVRYSEVEQAVWINKDQCFKPVPHSVWEFHIGGYKVIEKYLKSRKGRKLSLAEINHIAAIAGALAFTIGQMARIDEAYRVAFPGGG